MEKIIQKIKKTGNRIFYNPILTLNYEDLAQKSLSNNTFRGFHKIDKTKIGSGELFRNVLSQEYHLITKSIQNANNESDIDSLEEELCAILKFELQKNIKPQQLKSFNKVRKPVDIVIEHMVAMYKGFNDVRHRITPWLFLPLDSQMFQSPIVFSDAEIRALKLKRNFTFQDIWDKSHYYEVQAFLKDKADKLNIDRIYLDLVWNNRYLSNGGNLFETNSERENGKILQSVSDISNKKNKMQEQTKMSNRSKTGEDLSYTEKQLLKIKENKIIEKLSYLKSNLITDPRFQKLQISEPDISFPQDPTIWLTGFDATIRIQLKMQLTGEKIVINFRPNVYNVESREIFARQMEKCRLSVKTPTGKIYAPITDFKTKYGYAGGIDRDQVEEIKLELIATLNKMKSIG